MGRVKAQMMEDNWRGWAELDTHVCACCVDDGYLKSLIANNCIEHACDYCGKRTDELSAAPTVIIQEAIGRTVYHYFNDPTAAGVPWEGGESVIEPTDTLDVLLSIGLECQDKLFEDISNAFIDTAWVQASGGQWAASHPHEVLLDSWAKFCYSVKHEVRYFFSNLEADVPWEYSSLELLTRIGKLIDERSLISKLPRDILLYRVRERDIHEDWEINGSSMGAPPPEKARAGRMNPAGISYLYFAQEIETAFAEVLGTPPCAVAYGEFSVKCELNVIDLCQISLPSIFDESLRDVREDLLFVEDFVDSISSPANKDGREHIDYVPSQVVSEFFAKAFRRASGEAIHGMVYPSAIKPGGRNVVLFPQINDRSGFNSLVEFRSGGEESFSTWDDLTTAIYQN